MNFKQIKDDIDIQGFHRIKNFFSEFELNKLKNYADLKLEENNNQYFFLTSTTENNSILNDNHFFSKIENLLKKITIEFGEKIRNEEKLYKVLRVVAGNKSKKVSLKYHFDAHLLTLLIPIRIPNRENSDNGNLVIYKNLRKNHKNILKNICEKVFFQSFIFAKILKINYVKKFLNEYILHLVPGDIYIFNGFRTLHTNLNIDPKDVRATILVHYHDVFSDSLLVKLNRNIRIKSELTNIRKNKKISN